MAKVHKKQVLTYLKLTGMRLGYLLHFGEELMKDGISRILNGKIQQDFFVPPCLCVRKNNSNKTNSADRKNCGG